MLSDLLKKTAWAIRPDSLEQIYTILRDHKLGELDLAAIEAKLGKNLANTRNVVIEDGIAIIPISGPIAKRMNLFHNISGGTSAEMLIKEIDKALADEDIDGILLSIDSPGGTVDGTKEVADLIFESRGIKPIWAFASGTMASGAYWIGSQAERVSAFDTTAIGSIGVVMSHYDYSEADSKAGIKRTFITAGKYKRIVNDAEPLSADGREYLQTMLNDYYNLFVSSVAQGRGVTEQFVLSDMADGKMFIASKAERNKMVDAIEPIETTMKLLKEEVQKRKNGNEETVEEETTKNVNEGGSIVNLAELKKAHPDLVAQIQNDTRETVTAELQPRIDGLTKENDTLKASHESLESDVKDLKKKDAIRTHNELENSVTAIWDTALAGSDIPEDMHGKVHGSIGHKQFVTDDVLDVKSFKEAVAAEITDWEGKLNASYTGKVLGSGLTKKTEVANGEDTAEDDGAWEVEMLSLAGDSKAVEAAKTN